MEETEEDPAENLVSEKAVEVEADKPDSKRAKLDNEISLLDRLHGSDPLSALRDLDQLMQADLVRQGIIYVTDGLDSTSSVPSSVLRLYVDTG